jgi:putative ABC transport system ATP-binding protein
VTEIIKLENICKEYPLEDGPFYALKNVTLSIKEGESLAIMGTSGSGKSTLLNILGLIDSSSTGEYFLKGKSITEYKEVEKAKTRNKTFGFVLQNFELLPNYTVYKNVELPLAYSKVPNKEWKNKVLHSLEMVNLSDKQKSRPSMLSGGQKQRTAIARALVNDPEIIICDEPTGALDSKTSHEIMNQLMEIHRLGKTLIIVTHDDKVAKRCERILRIEDGRLCEEEM